MTTATKSKTTPATTAPVVQETIVISGGLGNNYRFDSAKKYNDKVAPVCNFSLYDVNAQKWVNASIWGNSAHALNRILANRLMGESVKVALTGNMSTWTMQDGTECQQFKAISFERI